jgi:hypothetical protein
MSFRRVIIVSSVVLACLNVAACGGKKKEADSAADVEVDNSDEFDDGMEMMQEFGGMNEEKVQSTFNRITPDLAGCLKSAGNGRKYLHGDVSFLIKVNMDGQAEVAHAKSSNLGNFQAERCMLGILKDTRWPKPVGGRIGLINYGPMGYDAPDDVRLPVQWDASDIEKTLSDPHNAESLNSCGRGGPFEITAYVESNGKVLSAGIAHTDDEGEETAACLVGAIERMTFNSPGSWKAKVTFRR